MRLKIRFIGLLIFSFFLAFFPIKTALADTCPTPNQNPCWVSKTPMPVARRSMGVAANATGQLYVVGGYNGNFLDTLEKYDPSTDTWTEQASLPTPRNELGFAFSSTNGKFYAAGGYNGSGSFSNPLFSEFDEYNPATDTWTVKSSMSTARQGLGLAAANGKLYAIGGFAQDGTAVASVEEYDPTSDTWTEKAPLPTPRGALGVITGPNGKIYAIGGHLDGAHGNTELGTVEMYDSISDTWTTKASMPTPRSSESVSVNAQGNIYVIGGNVGDPGVAPPVWTDVVEEYNPTTDIWTARTPLPVATMELGAALGNDNEVHVIGGWTSSSGAVNANYAGFAPINHAPVVGTVTVSPNPVQINTSVTASANFTDPDYSRVCELYTFLRLYSGECVPCHNHGFRRNRLNAIFAHLCICL